MFISVTDDCVGKWADDPEAFKKMKAALGVQLAQALESSFGLDAEASEEYVDVLTDGFAIRLFLFSKTCTHCAGTIIRYLF